MLLLTEQCSPLSSMMRAVAWMQGRAERRTRNNVHDHVFALANLDQLALFGNFIDYVVSHQ